LCAWKKIGQFLLEHKEEEKQVEEEFVAICLKQSKKGRGENSWLSCGTEEREPEWETSGGGGGGGAGNGRSQSRRGRGLLFAWNRERRKP
jgi:hypothetical protein